MNRCKYICQVFALLTAALIAGCGAASAPPLELPAPVTGQIDVSAPSSDGKATVTGNEGAVTGGATVLAINESSVETTLWQVTDFLFPKAYAQTFPGVCDLVGRACADAEPDGSFTLEIDAVVGDQIILVLISSDGEEISDRVTVDVPAGNNVQACGSGFDGNLVAIANVNGVVYSLFEGSTDFANKILLGDQSFEIPGCFAKDIAVIEESSGTKLIAAVSSTDNLLWIGRWNGTNLTMGLTYTTDIEPQKTAFAGDSTEVIIGGKGSSLHVELISVADGSTINTMTLPNPEQNTVVGLDTAGPFADGGYLGMVVGSDGMWFYLTFFHAGTFTNLTPAGKIDLTLTTLNLVYDPVIADASLGIYPQAGNAIRFLFSDRVFNEPAFRNNFVRVPGASPITLSDNIGSIAELELNTLPTISILPLTTKYPLRFVQAPLSTPPTAYVLTEDGYLWRIINYVSFATADQSFFSLVSELPDPLVIAIDETRTSLTGGNAVGTTTDLSDYLAP